MGRPLHAATLAVLLVLAGCAGLSAPEGSTVESGETTAGTVPTAGPLPDRAITVSVTAVVDGDTVRIAYDDGTSDTVRLVGVDTPEVDAENDPAEYEGVPETRAGADCLGEAGVAASNFAKDRLLGERVGLAFDQNTDRRGYYDRLLAYVLVDGRLFNHRLVATGHARVYTASDFSREARFLRAETDAREARRGLWRCADPDSATRTPGESGLVVAEVHADAEGNDDENLDGEYVVLANRGEAAIDLSGWTVTDAAGHSYTFENAALAPEARLTLYTGSGTDTESERYWGRSGAVWNNGGDTVTVRDADGDVVAERSY